MIEHYLSSWCFFFCLLRDTTRKWQQYAYLTHTNSLMCADGSPCSKLCVQGWHTICQKSKSAYSRQSRNLFLKWGFQNVEFLQLQSCGTWCYSFFTYGSLAVGLPIPESQFCKVITNNTIHKDKEINSVIQCLLWENVYSVYYMVPSWVGAVGNYHTVAGQQLIQKRSVIWRCIQVHIHQCLQKLSSV